MKGYVTGLVAVGYELHESRGKTDNSRRSIDLDPTTVTVLRAWRALQAAEYDAIGIEDPGWVFTSTEGRPVHPHSISQAFERIARRAGVPGDPAARPAPHARLAPHQGPSSSQGR